MAPTPSLRGTSGAAMDRMVGRVLAGRYRVLSPLGEGGMGTVYLCEHAVLGRRYAVKVLRPDHGGDPELAERFRNEAIAASRIGGDNVVDVLDFGSEDDGALYYVMEALEGRSLGALIAEDAPVEVDRALALVDQLCHALGAAHRRGVVHRDVKPDNVFVVRRAGAAEQVKVIDFGISQVPVEHGRERLTRAGAIIGTPEYMAPEQASGEPVDHRADVYALGVLAYELLTGTLPILATTPVATLVAHQTRTPEPPSRRRAQVSAAVDVLVMRALAKRPEDRFPSMEAFSEAIGEIRAGAADPRGRAVTRARTLVRPRADTVALPDSVGKVRWRRRKGVVIGAAIAVTVVAGVALGSWRKLATSRATATPTATATATATPTPTSTSTATATATGAAAAPASAAASASASASAAADRDPRSATVRRRSTRPPPADAHLEDPYGSTPLKPDPFR